MIELTSRVPLLAFLLNFYAEELARNPFYPWLARVPSNIADEASRLKPLTVLESAAVDRSRALRVIDALVGSTSYDWSR